MNRLRWSPEVRLQKNINKTLLCSRFNGESMFLSNECIDYLNNAIEKQMSLEQFIGLFIDEEDKTYIRNMLEQLQEKRMLFIHDDQEHIRPFKISWMITNNCNIRCTHCCVSAGDNQKGSDLNTQQLMDIADKLIALNPDVLIISGGEPLIRNDFKALVKHIRQHHTRTMGLMTNATLIDEDMAAFICETFHSVDVSIDGIDEDSCSIVRGKGVFEKTVQGIRHLQAKGMKRITASMVVMEQTKDLQDAFRSFCKNDLQVDSITRIFDPIGRGLDNQEQLQMHNSANDQSVTDEYVEKLFSMNYHKNQPDVFSCKGGYFQFVIDHLGDLYSCPIMVEPKYKMANVLHISDFKEYLENDIYKKTDGYRNFESLFPYNIAECKKCNKNMLCFNCVRDIEKSLEDGEFEKKCQRNRKLLELYWRE